MYLFITVLTDKYLDSIITVLTKNKYVVSAGNEAVQGNFIFGGVNDPCKLLFFQITTNEQNTMPAHRDTINKLLNQIGVKYYSMILTDGPYAALASNIDMVAVQNERSKKIKKINAPHLKLVTSLKKEITNNKSDAN